MVLEATFSPHRVIAHGDPQLGVHQGVAGVVDAPRPRPHGLREVGPSPSHSAPAPAPAPLLSHLQHREVAGGGTGHGL